MCSVCLQTPCHPRCPNASEAIPMNHVPIHRCSVCGHGIPEGDKYFQNSGEDICEYCMNEMSVEEVLELFGESLKTA